MTKIGQKLITPQKLRCFFVHFPYFKQEKCRQSILRRGRTAIFWGGDWGRRPPSKYAHVSQTVLSLTAPIFNRKSRVQMTSTLRQSGHYVLCRHTRKQQSIDKTLENRASDNITNGSVFLPPRSLKGRASCTMSLSAGCIYQLSVHHRWRRSAHSIYACDAGVTVRSWASRNKSGCVKLLIAVGMEL